MFNFIWHSRREFAAAQHIALTSHPVGQACCDPCVDFVLRESELPYLVVFTRRCELGWYAVLELYGDIRRFGAGYVVFFPEFWWACKKAVANSDEYSDGNTDEEKDYGGHACEATEGPFSCSGIRHCRVCLEKTNNIFHTA